MNKEAVAWFKEEEKKVISDAQADFIFTTYPVEEFMVMANNYKASGNYKQ